MLRIFEERKVRMVWSRDREEVWISASDLKEELGIVNLKKILRNIDRLQKRKIKNEDVFGDNAEYLKNFDTPLYEYGETFVSEEATYNMVFRCGKPETKLFTMWVAKMLKNLRVCKEIELDSESVKWLGFIGDGKPDGINEGRKEIKWDHGVALYGNTANRFTKKR